MVAGQRSSNYAVHERPVPAFQSDLQQLHPLTRGMRYRCAAALGAKIVSVVVPDLELIRTAHSATVGAEATQNFKWAMRNRRYRRSMGPDVRVTLAACARFTAQQYIAAQRIRRRAKGHIDALFGKQVDMLVSPTVPVPAPAIHPAQRRCGESNLGATGQLMKYIQLSNLLGMPAVALPVGRDTAGLPIRCAYVSYRVLDVDFDRCVRLAPRLKIVFSCHLLGVSSACKCHPRRRLADPATVLSAARERARPKNCVDHFVEWAMDACMCTMFTAHALDAALLLVWVCAACNSWRHAGTRLRSL